MEDRLKISVITVCLNPGEKLALTLDSILNQKYPDVEALASAEPA